MENTNETVYALRNKSTGELLRYDSRNYNDEIGTVYEFSTSTYDEVWEVSLRDAARAWRHDGGDYAGFSHPSHSGIAVTKDYEVVKLEKVITTTKVNFVNDFIDTLNWSGTFNNICGGTDVYYGEYLIGKRPNVGDKFARSFDTHENKYLEVTEVDGKNKGWATLVKKDLPEIMEDK